MRSDQELNPRFTSSQNWTFNRGLGGELKNTIQNEQGSQNAWTAFSHSGNEKNRVFLNQGGERFSNVSGISGADSILDGRSFVHWDFNRDGRLDLAIVNANKPLLQIFKNQLPSPNHFIAFRLQGGSQEGDEIKNLSNRDAIGAVITLQLGEQKLMRVLSAGEGFASQNSRTLVIGLGQSKEITSATIDWPSGNTTEIENLKAALLYEVKESSKTPKTSNYHLD